VCSWWQSFHVGVYNRSFRIGISVDGTGIGDEGELPLALCVAEDADEFKGSSG
jgi:hypothetical protein